jgi:hypothetical protein
LKRGSELEGSLFQLPCGSLGRSELTSRKESLIVLFMELAKSVACNTFALHNSMLCMRWLYGCASKFISSLYGVYGVLRVQAAVAVSDARAAGGK